MILSLWGRRGRCCLFIYWIELAVFTDETRQGLLAIVDTMKNRDGIEAVILGCTELPLILDMDGTVVPFLNTTALHVEAICKRCMQ